MSRVDSPRTNPAITSASSALVLVTPVPNSPEANRSVVARSFGRCTVTGPGGCLDRGRAVPVAHSRSGVLAGSAAFIAFAAQKRRHLALDRGLQQQLGSQLGDPLQGYGQIGAASEHLVDLCVQPLARRYPLRHGRGLLPLVA